MREINIPLPNLDDEDNVDIEVSVGSHEKKYSYRLESIPWDPEADTEPESQKSNRQKKEMNSSERIDRLKKVIKNYDKNWELIQIFAPLEKSLNIHILYRKKGDIK